MVWAALKSGGDRHILCRKLPECDFQNKKHNRFGTFMIAVYKKANQLICEEMEIEPYSSSAEVKSPDRFLITSDGLSDMVAESNIKSVLNQRL